MSGVEFMDGYTIQRLSLKDLIVARQIYRSHLIRNGGFFKSMMYAPDLTDYWKMLGIRHNGRLVGYIYPKVNRKLHRLERDIQVEYHTDNLYISGIAFDKKYIGTGVARNLVEHVLQAYNKEHIYLHIREGNIKSEKFSAKLGFKRIGVVRLYNYNANMYYIKYSSNVFYEK